MIDALLQPSVPVVHVTTIDPGTLDDVCAQLAERAPAPIVRVLRGRKVRTRGQLLDHLATAFGFPAYFGESWNATVDCLRDQPARPHLLIVTAASELLADVDPGELAIFAQVIAQVGGEQIGPTSFHLIAQDAPARFAGLCARLTAAGVAFAPLTDDE